MKKNIIALIPMYIFTILFVAAPLIYLVTLSFMTKSGSFGADAVFTLVNYKRVFEPTYLKTFIFSLRMSLISTVITAVIGYPFGYFMSRCEAPKAKFIILMLVILPFWTNALVRLYGFIILLRGNGLLFNILRTMGLKIDNLEFLYTGKAVIAGTVYALLPFMILTVFSSCSKLDTSVTEAARDLGATSLKTFFTVTLPLTCDGLIFGSILVFIPSMGLFFISDLLGGGKIIILGNLIKNQIMISHDYPFAAAISVIMLLMMLACAALMRSLTGNGRRISK